MQSLIKDINLAAEGRKKIDWVSNFMPTLNTLGDRFEAEQTFKGQTIVVSVHLEAKTAYLAASTIVASSFSNLRPTHSPSSFTFGVMQVAPLYLDQSEPLGSTIVCTPYSLAKLKIFFSNVGVQTPLP